MLLPGGMVRSGARLRTYGFKPLTGELELALSEPGDHISMPRRVTFVLAAALAHIGGQPVAPDDIGDLCVADRQFLMHRLAEHLGMPSRWLVGTCAACGEPFDLGIDVAVLPVKEAGEGYPVAEPVTSMGRLRLRVPTGADQESLPDGDGRGAVLRLVERCRLSVDGASVAGAGLSQADLDIIDEALDAVSPAVSTRVETSCPGCQARNEVDVDPYFAVEYLSRQILDDVHEMAIAYHWSERDILALPTARRHEYLARIDGTRVLEK